MVRMAVKGYRNPLRHLRRTFDLNFNTVINKISYERRVYESVDEGRLY